jgi:hypothetical protein
MKVKAKVLKERYGFYVECAGNRISGPFETWGVAQFDGKCFEQEMANIENTPPD